MNKYVIIAIVIAVLAIACFIGANAIVIGAFLIKAFIGLGVAVIFMLGFLVGRFFPYKSKKQLLNG